MPRREAPGAFARGRHRRNEARAVSQPVASYYRREMNTVHCLIEWHTLASGQIGLRNKSRRWSTSRKTWVAEPRYLQLKIWIPPPNCSGSSSGPRRQGVPSHRAARRRRAKWRGSRAHDKFMLSDAPLVR